VKPQEVALGAAPGEADLHFKMGDFGGGSLYTMAAVVQKANPSTVRVPIRTLDSYPIDLSRPIFMKIDSEGAEYSILQGGRRTIEGAGNLTLMMEFDGVPSRGVGAR